MDALESMAVAEPLLAKTLVLCTISDESDQDEERNIATKRARPGVSLLQMTRMINWLKGWKYFAKC